MRASKHPLSLGCVSRLREEGHDVEAIGDTRPGADDSYVLGRATRLRRILLTNDKDFAELAFLQRRASAGIVLLRLPRLRSRGKAERLIEVIGSEAKNLRSVMTVIETHAFRRRSFPGSR
jgi:predicted nuclease of predicted toxin-antitoxin system